MEQKKNQGAWYADRESEQKHHNTQRKDNQTRDRGDVEKYIKETLRLKNDPKIYSRGQTWVRTLL